MRHQQTCVATRARRPLPRPRVLPLALVLGLSTSHVSAQTVAHANGVALAAIEAIARMASQSADKDHAAEVMQAAIQAVTTIATTSLQAQASVDTTRVVNGGGDVVPVPAATHAPPVVAPVVPFDIIDVDVMDVEAKENLAPLQVDSDADDETAIPLADAVADVAAAVPDAPQAAAGTHTGTRTATATPVDIVAPEVVADPVAAAGTVLDTVAPAVAIPPEVSAPRPEPAAIAIKSVEIAPLEIKLVEIKPPEAAPIPREPVAVPPALPQGERNDAATTPVAASEPAAESPSEPASSPVPEPAATATPVLVAPLVAAPAPLAGRIAPLPSAEDTTDVATEAGSDTSTEASTETATAAAPVVDAESDVEPKPESAPAAAPVAVAAIAPVIAPETVSTPIPTPPPRRSAPGAVKFNPGMLVFPVDVDLFAEGNPVLPGSYRLDAHLNDRWQGKYDVRFESLAPGDRVAQPCFDQELLAALGFDLTHVNTDFLERLNAGESFCGILDSLIPGASYRYDAGDQVLHVAAPQIVLLRTARGFVDPSRWDGGINAGLLSYTYNGWHSKQKGMDATTSHYVGLRGGVNLGQWRFRYRATLTHGNDLGLQYRNDAFYVERAVPMFASRLTLGESNTDGRVFDAISFRGLSLQTDTRMQPDSQSGFAPVIRGIANSNARVTIHQRGSQIFETTVPPGPFIIDDLSPNGQGGDLVVTITEADGSARTFTQTYSSLPELLRPGVIQYSATAGTYRSAALSTDPFFGQLTARLGVNNTVTAYGGILLAQGYDAVTGGVGLNLPIGAVTLDGTYARTFLPGKTYTGTGWRLAWAKSVETTGTDVTLAMLRYANRGFYEPAQAFDLIDRVKRGDVMTTENRRAQVSLSVSQTLPQNWGALSFSGSVNTWWNRTGRDLQYNLGYGRSLGRVNASVNASRSRLSDGRWDNQVMFNVSLPLGPQSSRRAFLNTSYTRRRAGQSGQASVSGTLGDGRLVSYNLFGSGDKARGASATTNGGASLAWTNSMARVGMSASASRGGQQYGLTASGGVVAFRDGVLLASELGETVAIVQARSAQGAAVPQARGARLDARGHALVSNLQPYRENTVNIDPKGLSTDVALLNTSQKVAPTAGAVTLLKYQTQHGFSVLVLGRREDGSTLPFAAGVFDDAGKRVGYLGQGGQALLRLEAEKGQLQVKWGSSPDQQCRFDYDLGVQDASNTATDAGAGSGAPLRQLEVRCL